MGNNAAMSTTYILNYSIDLFYIVCDQKGVIISGNDLFREYTSHIKPKKFKDILADDSDIEDSINAIKKACQKSPDPVRFYAKTKQKSGSVKWVLWNVYCILDSLHFVGVQLVDVSSISAHDYERKKTLLEEFRFMLSHELRQPLTSVAGLVKLLIEEKITDENERENLLKMVNESVLKLDESIKLLVNKAAREL